MRALGGCGSSLEGVAHVPVVEVSPLVFLFQCSCAWFMTPNMQHLAVPDPSLTEGERGRFTGVEHLVGKMHRGWLHETLRIFVCVAFVLHCFPLVLS